MKPITQFIQSELKPRFWNYYPQIFPQLHLSLYKDKYQSPLHYDGTQGTGERPDRSVITSKYPYRLFDQSKQQSVDVIKAFMELNGIPELHEAVDKLCQIVGIERPKYSPEEQEKYRKYEERINTLEASANRQQAALWSSEGKAALDYIRRRGWTDEEIKEAGIGYISKAEAKTIGAQEAIGTTHVLSIPLRSGSNLYGFKVRALENGNPKYLYTKGTKKQLFNLTGIQQSNGRIVVVEGELDALHAQVKGLNGIVATGGGQLTEELLSAAVARGIKNITILFDADVSGAGFVRRSVDLAYTKGVSVLVATYPKGETLPNGTPIHDIDEYLQVHTIGELKTLIASAEFGTLYLYHEYTKEFEDITDEVISKVQSRVIELAEQTPDEVERSILFNTCAYEFHLDGKELFSAEALRAEYDKRQAVLNELKQKTLVDQALAQARNLQASGDTLAALQIMEEIGKTAKSIQKEAKLRKLLELPTEQSEQDEWLKASDDVETPYYFGILGATGTKEIERLTLPSGAITLVCAQTSHGKSAFLQNLALSVAQNGAEGSTLYFTYEESARDVKVQFENKYIGVPLSVNNIRSIKTYKRKGTDMFTSGKLQTYLIGSKEFSRDLYYSGKLRLFGAQGDSTDLMDSIRYICQKQKVKAVFVDYIQKLRKKGFKGYRLNEELKEICDDLNSLSIETDVPIVIAAQLNREAKSPVDMYSQNIKDAAEIEQVANKIILLWNSSFRPQKDDSKELTDWRQRTGVTLGQGGSLYAVLAKNRGGLVNTEAVFTHKGNEGTILQQKPTLQQVEEAELKNAPASKIVQMPF